MASVLVLHRENFKKRQPTSLEGEMLLKLFNIFGKACEKKAFILSLPIECKTTLPVGRPVFNLDGIVSQRKVIFMAISYRGASVDSQYGHRS